jgi:hypothetical protein
MMEDSMTPQQESELRQIAREEYIKVSIGRSHMPDPDSDEGQRKIDRLFDVIAEPFRKGAVR